MKSPFNAVLTVLALSVTIAAVADYFGSNVVAFVGNACRRPGISALPSAFAESVQMRSRTAVDDARGPLDEVMKPKPESLSPMISAAMLEAMRSAASFTESRARCA